MKTTILTRLLQLLPVESKTTSTAHVVNGVLSLNLHLAGLN